MNTVNWLGQEPKVADPAAWDALVQALRANILSSWGRAVSAYNGLKSARAALGLPFMVPQGSPESAAPGMSSASAWAPDLEQNANDLMSMVTIISSALADVSAGKRQLDINPSTGDMSVQLLPSDILRVDVVNGVPVIVPVAGGAPVHPVPNNGISTVGVPAIVWIATATTSVFALPAYWLVEKAVNGMTDVAEQKTVKTAVEKSYECVQSGKCSSEDVEKINKSIFGGAAGIRESKAKEAAAKAKPTTDITKAITTVALVGLGLGIIYAVVKLAPQRGGVSRTPSNRQLAYVA